MTVAREPSPALAAHPLRCAFLATRPAFLSVTALAVLLGLACAWHGGAARHWVDGWLTLVFALAAHAGVNVVNDYHDARNGTDAANSERLFPFTGGSRFIQNGVWSAQTTGIFGYLLLLSVILGRRVIIIIIIIQIKRETASTHCTNLFLRVCFIIIY